MSLRATVHPICTRFTNIFGTSFLKRQCDRTLGESNELLIHLLDRMVRDNIEFQRLSEVSLPTAGATTLPLLCCHCSCLPVCRTERRLRT